MGAKNWSDEDIYYLEDKWGEVSIPTIAKNLNRSINAVRVKAIKIGLRRHLHQGEDITLLQLLDAIGQKQNYSYLKTRLVKQGFPIKYKKSITRKYAVVSLKDFWIWSERNQNKLDFSNFERLSLGPEAKWVETKRKNDILNRKNFKTSPWTKSEDVRLTELLSKYQYNYYELSKMLRRTDGAIQRRICDLGLRFRPVKVDAHIKWTNEEYEKLGEMIKERYDYNMMSDILGKSAKAIRGRVYDMYLSENLDKVVSLIANGSWGYGRPELNITHKKLNGMEKKQVKTDIVKLINVLKARGDY